MITPSSFRLLFVAAGLVLAVAGRLSAQPPSSLPWGPELPRVDVAAGAGWFNGSFERRETPFRGAGQDWYNDAGWLGGMAGYYWTEHLKIEGEVAWSGTGSAWSYEEPLPGQPGTYRSTEHQITHRTLSAGLLYQFGRNQMLHPFVGAGLEVDFVRDIRLTMTFSDRPPTQPLREQVNESRAGGFGLAGVKAYFTERTFFRTDVKVARSADAWKIIPRVALGFDF